MSATGVASLTVVLLVLAVVGFGPDVWRACSRVWQRRRAARAARTKELGRLTDPGQALRAERRGERALRDALGPDGFEAYKALGFLHVFSADGRHGYLLYPDSAIVSFDVASGEPLDEYDCAPVLGSGFGSRGSSRSAELLARWGALRADEASVISPSRMHLLGRSVAPSRARRDLIRLSEWTSRRLPIEDSDSTRHPYHPDRGTFNS